MKKISILYDVSIIANNYSRTGVYFVALNILNELKKKNEISLSLYCQSDDIASAKNNIASLAKSADLPCVFRLTQPSLNRFKPKLKKILNKMPRFLQNLAYKNKNFILKFASTLKKPQPKPALKAQELAKYDAFFSPCFAVPDEFKNIKNYLIIYDLIPLLLDGYKDDPSNTWILNMLNNLDDKSTCFSISCHTKKDFLAHLPKLKDENIVVTPLACDESFKPASNEQINLAKQKYKIPENKKYIFSLCSLEPRKNILRVIKCFCEFIKKHNINDLVLALGGGADMKFLPTLQANIKNLNEYKDKILILGYVDSADLAPLYSGALFFVYTSQYEGFGLPPLEAMSCGSAVITSDNSSLPEVVGDAGIMIAYDSDEAHIKAYEKYYFDENFRKENAKKGLERSGLFSWQKCADIMVNKIKDDIEKAKINL